jgi:hypothetical protein
MGTNPYSVDSDGDGLKDPRIQILRCLRKKRRRDSKWYLQLLDYWQ